MPPTTTQPWLRAGNSPSVPKPAAWHASLQLGFEGRGAETLLVKRRHCGPLRVQRPFLESSGVCQAYVLHPPGGIVGGDSLRVDVRVEGGGRALLTTPGATKFYRSSGIAASQTQQVWVDSTSSVEWLPQEAIVFAGAMAESNTVIQLAPGAVAIGWEITCLGRPASGERFEQGSFRQRLEWREGHIPLVTEAVHCRGGGEALTAPWGFQGLPVYGTMVVHPLTHLDSEKLNTQNGTQNATIAGVHGESALALARHTAALSLTADDRFGASELSQADQKYTLVCRYLGPSAARCKAAFTDIWRKFRPLLLGIHAEVPRVWRT